MIKDSIVHNGCIYSSQHFQNYSFDLFKTTAFSACIAQSNNRCCKITIILSLSLDKYNDVYLNQFTPEDAWRHIFWVF